MKSVTTQAPLMSPAHERVTVPGLRRYFFDLEERALWRAVDARGKVVVDLGCGYGRILYSLHGVPCTLIGVDIDLAAVGWASTLPEARRKDRMLMVGNALALPLQTSSVDVVIALGIFELAKDLLPFLQEIQRVLRPEGYLAFSCWAARLWSCLPLLGMRSEVALYSRQAVEGALAAVGLEVASWWGMFFLPRRLFWGGYRVLPRRLRWHFVEIARTVEGLLGRYRVFYPLALEHMFVARRV